MLLTGSPPYGKYIMHRSILLFKNMLYLLTDATAVAHFSNEECETGGVRPSEPLLFTCEIYGVVLYMSSGPC